MSNGIPGAFYGYALRWVARFSCFAMAFLPLGLFSATSSGTVRLGSQPTFAYSYSPRLALGLDTNALYEGVTYVREAPADFNCSYISPASSATPASGTVTYDFR